MLTPPEREQEHEQGLQQTHSMIGYGRRATLPARSTSAPPEMQSSSSVFPPVDTPLSAAVSKVSTAEIVDTELGHTPMHSTTFKNRIAHRVAAYDGGGALSRGKRGAEAAKEAARAAPAGSQEAARVSPAILNRTDSVPVPTAPPPYIATRQFHPAKILERPGQQGGGKNTSIFSPLPLSMIAQMQHSPDGPGESAEALSALVNGGLVNSGYEGPPRGPSQAVGSRPQTRGTVASTVASGLSEFNTPEGHKLWLNGKLDDRQEEVEEDEYLPRVMGAAASGWSVNPDSNQAVVWH